MEIVFKEPYERTKSSVTQNAVSKTQQREKVEAQLEGLTTRVADGIRFGVENVGDYLHVHATDPGPGGNQIDLVADNSINIQAFGPLAISGATVGFGSDGDMLFQAGGDINVQPDNDFLCFPGAGVNIDGLGAMILKGDGISITMRNTGDLTVHDSSGNVRLRVDQDGDLHITAGKAIIADE